MSSIPYPQHTLHRYFDATAYISVRPAVGSTAPLHIADAPTAPLQMITVAQSVSRATSGTGATWTGCAYASIGAGFVNVHLHALDIRICNLLCVAWVATDLAMSAAVAAAALQHIAAHVHVSCDMFAANTVT